jgi:hypothetical protein
MKGALEGCSLSFNLVILVLHYQYHALLRIARRENYDFLHFLSIVPLAWEKGTVPCWL